jgi:hypothetical protein
VLVGHCRSEGKNAIAPSDRRQNAVVATTASRTIIVLAVA